MKKNTILFIAVLAILGACDFPPNLSKKFQKPLPQPALMVVSEEQVQLAQSVMWSKPPKVVFKRDVFRPLVVSRSTLTQGEQPAVVSDISMLELSGTLVSEHPIAFIRNKVEKKNYVVREQEYINAFKVLEINQKGVRLNKDGQDFYLKIPEAKK